MAQRKYRTAQGKMVDFGAMLTNNETVPALGNMNVNARGDEIQPDGTIVKSREEVMREYYKMNTTVPEEAPIPEGNIASADEDIPVDDWAEWEPKTETQSPEPVAEEKEPEQPKGTNIARMVEETADKPAPTGSLANSVASAKTVTGVDASKFEKPAGLKRL
tara:strand:+ start:352 stop:837 length:486 start_codon:yes stop_codon:yes gene_type:complete